MKLTHQIKRYTVIVTLKVEHNDLEIAHFLKVARLFIVIVRKELETAG